jgi:hypothetical protein
MAEADADHRHLVVVGCAHKSFERRDPVERVVDAGRGPGDEDRLQPFDIRQRLAAGTLTVLKVTLASAAPIICSNICGYDP